MRQILLLLLLLLFVVVVLAVANVSGQSGGEDEPAKRLPKLFDFGQFKANFGKHYKSLGEELNRQRIYLARAFKVFISMAKFHLNQLTYYLSINRRSDLTEEERRQAHMHLMAQPHPFNQKPRPNAERLVPVGPAEIKMELEEIERRSEREPQFEPLAKELHLLQGEEEDADADADVKGRLKRDTGSSAGFSFMPGVRFLASMVEEMLWSGKKEEAAGEIIGRKGPLPDEIFSDLRQTGCFLEPQTQGDCGSCYAFATLALFEHLYCRATGHLLAFSKQFMVSCGERMNEHDLSRCEGAFLGGALRFVDKFGLELEENWPYLAENGTCRLRRGERGLIRLEERGQFGYVLFDHFDVYLKHWPILYSLNLPADFEDYGGGLLTVADHRECQPDEAHAMLIVGHGRENGREYYLLRNSYGQDWGEQGYLRFDKRQLAACSSYMYGFGSQASFPPDHFNQLVATKLHGREPQNHWLVREHKPDARATSRASVDLLQKLDPNYREDGPHEPVIFARPQALPPLVLAPE